MLRAVILAIALGAAAPASARLNLEEIKAARPLVLVGESRLKVLGFRIFKSALYSETGEWQSPARSFRLELTYQRRFKSRSFVKRARKEWAHLGFDDPRLPLWLKRMQALLPDVRKGDTITYDVDPQGISNFYHNGAWLGEIADTDFAPLFIAIWLSPETSRPKHRKGLLDGN